MTPIPPHLATLPWYAPHQAWLRDHGLPHHDPGDAEPKRADLSHAYLSRANLSHANLLRADLYEADLYGADLSGTVLDPESPIPPADPDVLRSRGLDVRLVRGRWRVYGWRSRTSRTVPGTTYTPRRWVRAHALSRCPETDCHPGVYLTSRDDALSRWCDGDEGELVRVWAYLDEVVVTPTKQRAFRLYVLGGAA